MEVISIQNGDVGLELYDIEDPAPVTLITILDLADTLQIAVH